MAHGVELVIPGQNLGQPLPRVSKDDKVLEKRRETALLEHALQQSFQLRCALAASSPPSMLRQGMKRSRSAVSEPIRADKPSEMTRAALVRNSEGI